MPKYVQRQIYLRVPVRIKQSLCDLVGGGELSEILATSMAVGGHGKERKGPFAAKDYASYSA